MGPYRSLLVFTVSNVSKWVLIDPYAFLWVLISPYASFYILLGPYKSL